MEIWQAILLGFVQGITEFIPVSSSGHLELTQMIFNIPTTENFHLFLEFINIGTLLALLFYFRQRIFKIIRNVFEEHNYKLALNILITSIPAGLAGLIFADLIENTPFFNSIITLTVAMGIVGILMWSIDRLPHLKQLKNENALSPKRALAIGLMQTFALIPGTSRSGTTIVAGRLMGLSSESSAEYSFLASIPIMCGVCLKIFLSESSRNYFFNNLVLLAISNLVALIVGLLALKFLLSYLKKPGSLQSFGRYRVVLACIVLGVTLILM